MLYSTCTYKVFTVYAENSCDFLCLALEHLYCFRLGIKMEKSNTGGTKRMIYVGGLAEEVDTKVLNAAFIPFGDIIEVGASVSPFEAIVQC